MGRGVFAIAEMDLSSWSAVAAIVAVPLMIVGWFMGSRKQRTQTARSSGSGTATAVGDMTANSGGLVIGHNAQITVRTSLEPPQDGIEAPATRSREGVAERLNLLLRLLNEHRRYDSLTISEIAATLG